MQAGSIQFGTRQISVVLSKQHGIFPTAPIQRNVSILEQSGTSPFIQKLPLLLLLLVMQTGITQFGVLVARVTESTQTGVFINEPMHWKVSEVEQSGVYPPEQ